MMRLPPPPLGVGNRWLPQLEELELELEEQELLPQGVFQRAAGGPPLFASEHKNRCKNWPRVKISNQIISNLV